MTTLEVRNLRKNFGDVAALTDVSLTVKPGEIYGFVGSNGAGKSTTMRIILGVLAADAGEVLWDGKPITADNRRDIGYMPEERGLYAKEKILDQLVFLARLHGLGTQEAAANAQGLLEQLGLAERTTSQLTDLSLGNQQRVQLAASLVHNPDVLVLDEPFSGLDPIAVQVMSDMLISRAQQGTPVIFSSHQLDLVQRLCDRVGIISGGKMRAQGTVMELRTQGPARYEVGSPVPAQEWCPAECRIIAEEPGQTIIEKPEYVSDQDILAAALAVGPVHSFTRRVPDLVDLFKEFVS